MEGIIASVVVAEVGSALSAADMTAVWKMDVATGEETLVAENGYLPVWLER